VPRFIGELLGHVRGMSGEVAGQKGPTRLLLIIYLGRIDILMTTFYTAILSTYLRSEIRRIVIVIT